MYSNRFSAFQSGIYQDGGAAKFKSVERERDSDTHPAFTETTQLFIGFHANGNSLEAINHRRSTRLERIHKLGWSIIIP
jgi:hypothetical protein